MFKLISVKNVEDLATTSIIEQANLTDFINSSAKTKLTLLCPTNAIDIKKGIITKDCVDCTLCWVKSPKNVGFDKSEFDKFYKLCEKDKLFVYKWMCLILENKSGINIKVAGYSRDKRIPLIVQIGQAVYIFKVARTVRDLDYENADLEEIISIIISQSPKLTLHKVIILMKESKLSLQYLDNFDDVSILSLRKIYYNVLKNKFDLKFHLKESNFDGILDK